MSPVSSIAPEGWGPKEGGNATSYLHSRGSPTKGTKLEVKTYARGQLPLVDYSLSSTKLLPQSYYLSLLKFGILAARGHQQRPPTRAPLTPGMYADGHQPRGRPTVNTKISMIHFERLRFPLSVSVPTCRNLIPWMELLKVVHGHGLPYRAEAL